MIKNKKEIIKSLVILFLVVAIFLVVSFYAGVYIEEIENLIGNSFGGMLLYAVINILDVILAPVSLIAVIGIGSSIWGWFITALLTIVGWTLGGYIAFVISRRFGIILLVKFIKIEKLQKIERKIDPAHLFWSIVLLRIVIPADLLSYALGLFSNINIKKYLIATVLGVTPLAFGLAYLGSLPIESQIISLMAVGVLFVTGLVVKLEINKYKNNNMDIIKWSEARIKKLKWYDLELTKATAIFTTLFLLTVSRSISGWLLAIEWYWYFALAIIFSVPLIKRFFINKG